MQDDIVELIEHPPAPGRHEPATGAPGSVRGSMLVFLAAATLLPFANGGHSVPAAAFLAVAPPVRAFPATHHGTLDGRKPCESLMSTGDSYHRVCTFWKAIGPPHPDTGRDGGRASTVSRIVKKKGMGWHPPMAACMSRPRSA